MEDEAFIALGSEDGPFLLCSENMNGTPSVNGEVATVILQANARFILEDIAEEGLTDSNHRFYDNDSELSGKLKEYAFRYDSNTGSVEFRLADESDIKVEIADDDIPDAAKLVLRQASDSYKESQTN